MSSSLSDHQGRCGKCGSFLRDEAAGGLCPGCVLRRVLDIDTAADEAEGIESPDSLLRMGELAGYSLLEEIGRGGMGVVFKARQFQPSRMVALKVIASGELASPKMVARFQLEAKAAANLHHPNIVPIFEVGEHRGWHFFSMQLVEGPTLDKVIRAMRSGEETPGGQGESGSMAVARRIAVRIRDPRELARLLQQIVLAVHHAHQQGILHRDIKPTNVLLNADGKPFLTDFGLAKVLNEDFGLTMSAAVLGTPAYMSPEQASGATSELSVAADVYSLGALMYELLAGTPPFSAPTTAALLRKIIEDEPKLPGAHVGPARPGSSVSRLTSMPGDLEVICLKCLEKEPHKRNASAGHLAEDLERWLQGETILARPATRTERTWKWARRHPALAGLVATAMLAVLVITGGSIWFNFRLNDARLKAERQARENLDTVIRQNGDAAAAFAQRMDALNGLHPLTTALKLAEHSPRRQEDIRLRLGLIAALAPQPWRVWDAEGIPVRLAFSPEGDRLFLRRKWGPPCVWRLEDGARLDPYTNTPAEGSQTQYALSRDGKVAAEMNRAAPFASLLNLETGKRAVLPSDEDTAAAFAFSDDGKTLLTGGQQLRQWDVATHTEIPLAKSIRGPFDGMFMGSGGSILILIRPGEEATLLTYPGLEALSTNVLCNHSKELSDPFSSRDGKVLALGYYEDMRLFSPTRLEFLGLLPHPGLIYGGDFSPDGRLMATASFRGGARLWDLRTKTLVGPQINHENGARCAAFSPDGQWLATGGFDYQVRLWRPHNMRQWGTALPHDSLVRDVLFSPNARYLATASTSGMVRLWDLWLNAELLAALDTTYQPWVASEDLRSFLLADGTNTWRVGRFVDSKWVMGEPINIPGEGPKVWDREARRIASAVASGGVSVRKAASGLELSAFATRGEVTALAFSPDGSRLAVATATNRVGIVDLATGRELALGATNFSGVAALGWSRDGKILITGEDARARLWHAATGELFSPPVERVGNVSNIRFSPDGRQAVVCFLDIHTEPSCAVVIDLATGGALPETLDHGDGIEDAAYSPDGSLIATAGQDNAARVWKAATRAPAGPALRHEFLVRVAVFSPDSKHLATGAIDCSLRLWDLATGELLAPPLLFPKAVDSIAFAPDGSHLIVHSSDGSLWRVALPRNELGAAHWNHYASLATGHKPDPSGNLVRVKPAELARESALLPPAGVLGPNPARTLETWHFDQARLANLGGNSFAAVFHWRKLAELRPGDAQILQRLKAVEEQAGSERVEIP